MLTDIATKNWRRLTLTYGLTSLSGLAQAIYPLATAFAINGVIDGNLWSIGWLVGAHVLMMGFEVTTKMVDTRIFTQIYSVFATDIVAVARVKGIAGDRVAARASLSREYVDFFEKDVPETLHSIVGMVVGLASLLWLDPVVGLFCVALLPPLAAVNIWLSQRSTALTLRLNDRLEREVGILQERRLETVARHFRALGGWRIKLSDAEAKAFGLMELAVITLFLAALLRLGYTGEVKAGDVYAVFAYIWRIVGMLDMVPVLVQRFSVVRDLDRRFKEAEI